MTKRIYAGNLPFETTEDEVRRLFKPFGEVHSVTMIADRDSGRFRGFCFVDMEEDAADEAIGALDGKEVGGRKIRVNEARPRTGGKGQGRRKERRDERPPHERTGRGGEFPHSGGSSRGRSQDRGGRGSRGGSRGDSDFPHSGGGSRRDL